MARARRRCTRHRHQRPQPGATGADRLGAGHQPPPQRAGHGGQDDVVDGAAVRVAHLAVARRGSVVRSRSAAAGERVTAIGVSCSERRFASALTTVPTRRVAVAPRHSESEDPDSVERGASGDPTGVRTDSTRSRPATARAGSSGGPTRRAQRARAGVDVEQHLAQVDGRDAVDQDLVGLGEQRDAAALQPLDEVDLPQRPVGVERPRHDPGHQLAELVHRARPRQRRAAYVVAEVEVRRRRPRPGWRGGRAPGARAGGSAARTRSGRRCAPPARRSRSPTSRGRRSPPWRCASGSCVVSAVSRARSRARSRSFMCPLFLEPVPPWDSGRASEAGSPGPLRERTHRMSPTDRHPRLALLAAALLAGCGGGDSGGTSTGPQPTQGRSTSPSPATR